MYRSRIAAKKIETESTTIKETSYPHEEWDAIIRKQTALRALSLLSNFGADYQLESRWTTRKIQVAAL